MFTRRQFLKSWSSLLGLAPTLPLFIARTGQAAPVDRDGRILVVVQLDGGNDALNTLVPYADPNYARLRPRLKIPKKNLLRLSDALGLHPSLKPLDKLLQAGHLGVVPGVGYPNPNRSHFESMAVWHTARLDPEERQGYGWIGRALDERGERSCVAGSSVPGALRGRRSSAVSVSRTDDMLLANPASAMRALGSGTQNDLLAFVRRQAVDAHETVAKLANLAGGEDSSSYPATGLAERLKLVARLLKTGMGGRVYYTVQGSYDTHAGQLFTHASLLSEFAGAVAAFFDDLGAAKLAERVVLLAFSEFGRTIKENGSGGTDHGTAEVVFIAGPGIRGGVVGQTPSLTDLVNGEPRMTTDFRRIYATLLEGWLDISSPAPLGGSFAKLPLLRAH
jgi:uncharacterized protein (DUF1501 family)